MYLRLVNVLPKRINSPVFSNKTMNEITKAFKEVYNQKKYYLISGTITALLFLFNTLINNYKLLKNEFSIHLFWALIKGAVRNVEPISLLFLVLISLLAGIVVSMSIFLLRKQIVLGAGIGSSGIIVSILAPACPSCALGLLSILGLGGFLAVLPFKGLELGFLGVIVLAFSIWFLARKITTNVCLPPKRSKRKKN